MANNRKSDTELDENPDDEIEEFDDDSELDSLLTEIDKNNSGLITNLNARRKIEELRENRLPDEMLRDFPDDD